MGNNHDVPLFTHRPSPPFDWPARANQQPGKCGTGHYLWSDGQGTDNADQGKPKPMKQNYGAGEITYRPVELRDLQLPERQNHGGKQEDPHLIPFHVLWRDLRDDQVDQLSAAKISQPPQSHIAILPRPVASSQFP